MALFRIAWTPSDPANGLRWFMRFAAYFAGGAALGLGVGIPLHRKLLCLTIGLLLANFLPCVFGLLALLVPW